MSLQPDTPTPTTATTTPDTGHAQGLDVDTIDYLDFTPGCELIRGAVVYGHVVGRPCRQPGTYIIRNDACPCGTRTTMLVTCLACWAIAGERGVLCARCQVTFNRDDVWHILESIARAAA